MYIGLNVNYRLFLSDFNETLICGQIFEEKLKYQISFKTVHWEPTDMTKLIVAFRNFANAPNKPYIVGLRVKCQMLQ